MPGLDTLLVASPVLVVGVAMGIVLAGLLSGSAVADAEAEVLANRQALRTLRVEVAENRRHILSLESANEVLLQRLKEASR